MYISVFPLSGIGKSLLVSTARLLPDFRLLNSELRSYEKKQALGFVRIDSSHLHRVAAVF